jgi:hypothetical protein
VQTRWIAGYMELVQVGNSTSSSTVAILISGGRSGAGWTAGGHGAIVLHAVPQSNTFVSLDRVHCRGGLNQAGSRPNCTSNHCSPPTQSSSSAAASHHRALDPHRLREILSTGDIAVCVAAEVLITCVKSSRARSRARV